jgi:hypothetical protein
VTVRTETSFPNAVFMAPSMCRSVVEDRSEVADTPFGFARGVAAPSMAISSVMAEVLTGRKEAMIGDVRSGGG